eukprot:s1182_g4.t1
MTIGEWDQLRGLMRRADASGRLNELMTVHRKEKKNAPMNRAWPPDVTSEDDGQTSQAAGSGSAAGHDDVPAKMDAAFVPPPGAFFLEEFAKQAAEFNPMADSDPPTDPWKSAPAPPPGNLQPEPSGRPILTLFGKVQQQSAAAAAAAAQAAHMAAAMAKNSGAGFPKQKSGSSSAAEAHPPPKASAAACGSERAQKESQLPIEPKMPKSKAKAAGKIARISEEVDVVEPSASPSTSVESNATASACASMTDASKRRYDAMEAAVDRAYEDDEFSIVSETESSPPCFPNYQAGLPSTFSWGPNWNDNGVLLDYSHVDQAIPKPAWVHSSGQWGKH